MQAITAARIVEKSNLKVVLETIYGVGVVVAPVEAVMWAVDRVVAEHGREVVQKELRAVNTLRVAHGRMPVYLPYGHAAF